MLSILSTNVYNCIPVLSKRRGPHTLGGLFSGGCGRLREQL